MSKKVWKDLGELSGAPAQDEFAPEVAQALAQLRASHGLSNVSCQSEGNQPGNVPLAIAADADAFRDELHQALPGVNRRGFLQLTGAAAVFALAGCWHKDPDTLVPYAQQPEGTTLGKPVWWSSVLRDSGRAVPLLVKTYDGRPIKLEGNPDSPINSGNVVRGALDLRSQAALLNLYDPDRQQAGPIQRSGGQIAALGWDKLDAEVGQLLASGSIALVTGGTDGVATKLLLDLFVSAFGGRVRHVAYDAFAPDAAVAAREAAFGKDQAKPAVLHLERAAVIVTLGSDILGGGHTGLAEQVAFGDFRRLRGAGAAADMGQLIAFEPTLSQTGTLADVRVRASLAEVERVAWALAKELGGDVPAALLGQTPKLNPVVDGTAQKDPIAYTAERLRAVKAAGKHSLVYVGGATHCGDASRGLHLAANLINSLLGNEGVTVETASVPASAVTPSASGTLQAITAADVVILVGANPAISLPGAAAALAKAKAVIVLADRADESFQAAATAYLAPSLHGLESWGDAEPAAGVYALQQPCIHPLWDCRGAEQSLIAFAVAALGAQAPKPFTAEKAPADPKLVAVCSRKVLWQPQAAGVRNWHDFVQTAWLAVVKPQVGAIGDDRAFWNAALAKGVVVAQPAVAVAGVAFNAGALATVKPAAQTGDVQLVISASRTMRDGAGANNAWLQEIPDPVSRITWDNYLAISPADAERFGVGRHRYDVGSVDRNPVVELTVGGQTVKLAVHVQEGQHPGTVECFFGWGRAGAGKVAEGAGVDQDGGVNAFMLLAADRSAWGFANVSVKPTGAQYKLACTQGHNTMDGREIVIDNDLDTFRAGKHADHTPHKMWENGNDGHPGAAGRLSMWQSTHVYPGRRWGMTIDMTTCIGCQACVVACSAENNVPVVGRDEVRKGREMHWIRIDRYFSSRVWGDHGTTPAAGQTSGDAMFGAPSPDALLDIDTAYQPMLCQQCGHAPCEEVCPAMATMHNEEGLNIQVYNRCIGTRYCSNNCPYKVRRFNFYEYSKYRAGPVGSAAPFDRVVKNLTTEMTTSSSAELTRAPLMMVLNPAVSVRSKGVMEKCNFCVQRTRDVRENEKATGRKYDDKQVGAITTACAQTCPTGAITFGDINDPESKVNQVAAGSPHGYKLLDKELNTRPSVIYLQRIRNRPVDANALAAANAHGDAAAHGADAAPASQGGAH